MNLEQFKSELSFRTSRSAGSGGQHVNKVETKVEVSWRIEDSLALTVTEKERLLNKLSHQLTKSGVLQRFSQASRSQHRNKKEAIAKLEALIQDALQVEKVRKPSTIPSNIKAKRLQKKRFQSEKKQARKKVNLSTVDFLIYD